MVVNLKNKRLDEKILESIKEEFGVHPKNSREVYLNCDEAHSHNFGCLAFRNRPSAVVLRLIYEIENYQRVLDNIKEKADYKKY